MATNLLLEGDDLEALLIRARAEGGPNARIVRAEKIRHGGVMGFFTRETFEVAIEVPGEEDLVAAPGAELPTCSPVETLLERIQEQLFDTTEIDLTPVDPVPVEYPQPEPATQPDDDTPLGRPAFTPFGGTFEAALEAVGVVIAPAEAEPEPEPTAQAEAGEHPVVVPVSIAGVALAAPTPPAEILGGPGALLVPIPEEPQRPGAVDAPAPPAPPEPGAAGGRPEPSERTKARGRRAVAGDGTPELHDMLDPVLAVERSAARSVAGQPLSAPAPQSFRIPMQRNGSAPAETPTTDAQREREVSQVAHTAAYAAVYAAVHEDGIAAARRGGAAPGASERVERQSSRAASFAPLEVANRVPRPRHGVPQPLPSALSESWRHSSERGTDPRSGAWDFLPTSSLMVTGFPGSGPYDGSVPHNSSVGARPEFTALLEQLRASSGAAQPEADDQGRHAQAPAPAMQPDAQREPLIPEPIAAEAAWTVVERVEAADLVEMAQDPSDHAQPIEADLVESIRRQAQAAIDEAFTAAGLAEEAERMAEAAATIPQPRRTAPETETAAAPSPAPSAAPSGDTDRLVVDQETLRRLGVPSAWIESLQGGDRYAGVWRALEQLPTVDIDPDAAVVAVVGAADVVRLEAHRIAVDLADANEPRPVVLVPASGHTDVPALVGRHPQCVVAIESDGTGDPSQVLESLGTVDASAVIVVLDAQLSLSEARSWLFSLGSVDALALDGVATAVTPALMLQLGLPVVRLDGIPIDRITWTALLCAQLEAAHPAR